MSWWQFFSRMDDRDEYQPPSLASLSMKVVIFSNLDENQLVQPIKERVNNIRSLLTSKRYRINVIILEVKRCDETEPTNEDWTWGRKDKPYVTIGSFVNIFFNTKEKKGFRVNASSLTNHAWYKNFFHDADQNLSLKIGGYKELYFIQENFHKSCIQTSEWEKTVRKKNFSKFHKHIPWKYRKESFEAKGEKLLWRIEHKSEKLLSSWLCVSEKCAINNMK